MQISPKILLAVALLASVLFGAGIAPAKAAEAHIVYFTATHASPPNSPPYNIVFYSYTCSWTGAGRMGYATLDWYQPNTWTNIFANGYNSSPVSVTGTTVDAYRPSSLESFYQLQVEVMDSAPPFDVYALARQIRFP